MSPSFWDKASIELMHFQKSDAPILVDDFLPKKMWSVCFVHVIYLWTEHKYFYWRLNFGIFVDSTPPLIFNLWKEVYFLNSAQKRNTHHGNTFGMKNKVNIRKSAEVCSENPVTVAYSLRVTWNFPRFGPPMRLYRRKFLEKCSARVALVTVKLQIDRIVHIIFFYKLNE